MDATSSSSSCSSDSEFSLEDVSDLELGSVIASLSAKDLGFLLMRADREQIKAIVLTLECHGCIINFLEQLIDAEIDSAVHPDALFREDSAATRLLSGCLYTQSSESFLQKVVLPTILKVKAKGLLEINPIKLHSSSETQENLITLCLIASEFLSDLLSQIPHCPLFFRHLLKYIKEKSSAKFPTFIRGYEVLGAFFFLRYICPAFISPETYLSRIKPPSISPEVQRSLIYLSKLLQSAGSCTEFDSSKEAFLQPANDFIKGAWPMARDFYEILLSSQNIAQLVKMTISDSSGSSGSGGGSKKKKKAVEMILDIHHVAVLDPEISATLRKLIQELDFTKSIQQCLCMMSPFGQNSHPSAWDIFDVLRWLRKQGFAVFVPQFIANNISGIELCHLNRKKVKVDMGVVVYSQQRLLLENIHKITTESLFKKPRLPDELLNKAIKDWTARDVNKWMRLTKDIHDHASIFKRMGIEGPDLNLLSDDILGVFGFNRQERFEIGLEIRKLSYIKMIKRVRTDSNDGSDPTIYDEALDNWLKKMDSGSLERPVVAHVDLPVTLHLSTEVAYSQDYVAYLLKTRKMLGNWQTCWFIIHRVTSELLVFSKLKGLAASDPNFDLDEFMKKNHTKPTKVLDLKRCKVQGASSLVSRPFVLSLQRRGKDPLFLRASSKEVFDLLLTECLSHSEIVDVSSMSIEMFSLASVSAFTDGKICDFNKQAEKLFGYTKEQVIDKNVKILMPESVAKYHDGYLKTYRKNQNPKIIGKPRILKMVNSAGEEKMVKMCLGEYYEKGVPKVLATYSLHVPKAVPKLPLSRVGSGSPGSEEEEEEEEEEEDEIDWSDEEDVSSPPTSNSSSPRKRSSSVTYDFTRDVVSSGTTTTSDADASTASEHSDEEEEVSFVLKRSNSHKHNKHHSPSVPSSPASSSSSHSVISHRTSSSPSSASSVSPSSSPKSETVLSASVPPVARKKRAHSLTVQR